MEIVKLFIIVGGLFSNWCFSQTIETIVCGDIMIRNETSVFNEDTLKHIMISKITVHQESIYKNETIAMMFDNDSLFAISYDRYPNNGSQVSISLNDSCRLYDSVSIEHINTLVGDLIFNLMSKGHEIMLLKPKKAKLNFEALQYLMLIIDNDKYDFLIDFCMYINLDLVSLDTHFLHAKYNNDEKRMFLISQAFRMSDFDQFIKIEFDLIWSELLIKHAYFEFDNLLSKKECRRINTVFNKKVTPYILEQTCIIGF
jgi:hypothetical protein